MDDEVKVRVRTEERHVAFTVEGRPIVHDEKRRIRIRVDNGGLTWREGRIRHVTLAGRLVDADGELVGPIDEREFRQNVYLLWDHEPTGVPVPEWIRPLLTEEGVDL